MIHTLAPLPVVVPLLGAAVIAAVSSKLPRRLVEVVSIAIAATATVISLVLMVHAFDHRIVYWFSGWKPRAGTAVGISFAIDAFGGGMAALISFLVTAAFVFSWSYFAETVSHRFTIITLLFLGAMNGFAFTGDLFNLFVWFELMGFAAYALTGYKIEERAPLQGALNFAFTNGAGSFALLAGIGLLYGRTGALNMAQIGHTLVGTPADGVIVVAFTLVVVGLLVKGAIVPFHFWLADAHAVAPVPVCVLFSGVMVELGLYGAARIYWTIFVGTFARSGAEIGHVLIAIGCLTAVIGAAMCFFQQHIKRLLAFSTISHMGLFLVGFGLLDHNALGGVAVYVLSHGLAKASLFMCAGIILHRLGSVDESALEGRGRGMWSTAIVMALGGLAIAEMPPFGTALGRTLIEDSAVIAGFHWIPWLYAIVCAVTGGAILRIVGRVFLGWGPPERNLFPAERFGEEEDESETARDHTRTPVTMMIPALVLLALALGVGLAPHLTGLAERSGSQFQDSSGYAARVLTGVPQPVRNPPIEPASVSGAIYGVATAVGAIAIALIALFRRRLLPAGLRRPIAKALTPTVVGLRRLHSGHVGDYLAWFTVGLAAFGGLFALVAR